MFDPTLRNEAIGQAAAWLLTYALHSTLLISLAWLSSAWLARRSVRLEEAAWRCALLGALLTASIQLAAGREPLAGRWALHVPATAPAVKMAAPAAGFGGELENGALVRSATLASSIAPVRQEAAATAGTEVAGGAGAARRNGLGAAGERAGDPVGKGCPRISGCGAGTAGGLHGPAVPSAARAAGGWGLALAKSLLALWLPVAALLSLTGLRSYLRLRRMLRGRPEVVGGGALRRLLRFAGQARMAHPVRLTCSGRLSVPVALGLRQPEICLPPRALFELSVEHEEALLAHELGHLVRRDPLWLLIVNFVAGVFFFQPLNWVARRRLRDLAELRADEWAVERTGRPLSLARCLAEVAAWSVGGVYRPLPAPGMADRGSHLAYRVRRLLDGVPAAARAPRTGWVIAGMAGVLSLIVVAAPGISIAAVGSGRTVCPDGQPAGAHPSAASRDSAGADDADAKSANCDRIDSSTATSESGHGSAAAPVAARDADCDPTLRVASRAPMAALPGMAPMPPMPGMPPMAPVAAMAPLPGTAPAPPDARNGSKVSDARNGSSR